MRKLHLLLAGFMILAIAGTAQTTIEKRYTPSYTTGGSYVPLSSSATEIPFAIDWDDEISDPITLPFTFKYQNVSISTVTVETYGSLWLNGIYNEDTDLGNITGLFMDYDSKNRGKVYYETTGTAGNRIFKVEYRNVGRYNDDIGNDTFNFQVWLYETNNAIEYRAGYSNLPASEFGVDFQDVMDNGKEFIWAGLLSNVGDSIAVSSDNIGFHTVKLNGSTITDTINSFSDFVNFDEPTVNVALLGSYPSQGSVIRFVPVGSNVGVPSIEMDLAKVYPNPSKDGIYNVILKEHLSDASLSIYDITGKLIHTQALNGNNTQLKLSHLSAGQYLGKIQSEKRAGLFKLIKE